MRKSNRCHKKEDGDIQKGLPKGVSFNVAYDRSSLIEASIENVKAN